MAEDNSIQSKLKQLEAEFKQLYVKLFQLKSQGKMTEVFNIDKKLQLALEEISEITGEEEMKIKERLREK